jgi:hypothetical protein
MIDFTEATIEKLILHRFSLEDDKELISNSTISIDDSQFTKNLFLTPFQSAAEPSEFGHVINVGQNTLYNLLTSMYDGENFVTKSKQIFKYLKSVSKHPNIKDGDLFIAKLEEIKFENKYYEGIGIYKFENKESFLETSVSRNAEAVVKLKQGISGRKLDKACLVLFTKKPYTVFVIDNGKVETDYWANEFIGAKLKNDSTNNTTKFLSLTKSYITKQLPEEFEVSKTDQIELLNKSIEYFKNNEEFNKKEFEKKVFSNSEIVKSFREFDTEFQSKNDFAMEESFKISPSAVKKSSKNFKSILKLDLDFHIYIHGDRSKIEKGVEKDGRKYYKIYFENEH